LTVFNKKDVDHTKEPMFFGEPCNTARYDKMKYPKFDSITEQQLSFFWQPQEVALSTDINDFKNKLTPTEQRIYVLNLQYQTLLDSVQGRSPNQVLLPIVSLPELETWIETWAFSETIHSRSYTYIIKNIFDNPSEILDDIMRIPQITSRAGMVTKAYEVLEELIHDKTALMYDKKVALFRCIISIHALEAIRFYVSFACAYSYVERGLMEGNGKIMTLINRDEFLHSGGTHYILTRWLKGLDDPEMTEIAKEYAGDITSIILDTYNQECDWIDFLFSEGNIPLLNAEVLKTYLQYLCDNSFKTLGCSAVFGVEKNPLPWLSSYTNAGSTQVAPQEVELSSYKLGSIDMNTSLTGLSLDD
jgi:ribonucleoside-diphosphate reductase beta chain